MSGLDGGHLALAIIGVIAIIVTVFGGGLTRTVGKPRTVEVVRVIDGDTVVITPALDGVDTV